MKRTMIEEEKILSVIVPAYNMEGYLGKCLESLVIEGGMMSSLEVIVVNDGSKDSTLKVALLYKSLYPKVFKVIDKENGNYGSCVNRGLKEATGKYIKILDADDSFSVESLGKFIGFLHAKDADLVISPYVRVDSIHQQKVQVISWDMGYTDTDIVNKALRRVLFSKDFQMHAVTYKRTIFSGWDYYQTEGISYTDQEWMFMPMSHVRTVVFFEEVLYHYLVGREGQTMDVEVQKRHVGHNVMGLYQMLLDYNKLETTSGVVKDYLLWRLDLRSSHIYKTYLLYDLPRVELEDIDNQIRRISEDYYHHMDKIVVHQTYPYHFIRSFRKFHKKTLLFQIYCWYMAHLK